MGLDVVVFYYIYGPLSKSYFHSKAHFQQFTSNQASIQHRFLPKLNNPEQKLGYFLYIKC